MVRRKSKLDVQKIVALFAQNARCGTLSTLIDQPSTITNNQQSTNDDYDDDVQSGQINTPRNRETESLKDKLNKISIMDTQTIFIQFCFVPFVVGFVGQGLLG